MYECLGNFYLTPEAAPEAAATPFRLPPICHKCASSGISLRQKNLPPPNTDYHHITDFQFKFLALVTQCGADEDAQFHQYKKAMSEEFHEAMEHAMKIPKSLAEIKEQAEIFGQLQTERRACQAKLELEMQEATLSMTAPMNQVQVNDDEEAEMAIAASYNQGQKRQ
jgi:hypothetical protein